MEYDEEIICEKFLFIKNSFSGAPIHHKGWRVEGQIKFLLSIYREQRFFPSVNAYFGGFCAQQYFPD